MDNEEQKIFIRFVIEQLKACHHELNVYRALSVIVKEDGFPAARVDAILKQARQSQDIRAMTDKFFQGFDELLGKQDEADPGQALRELLERWNPKGEPN